MFHYPLCQYLYSTKITKKIIKPGVNYDTSGTATNKLNNYPITAAASTATMLTDFHFTEFSSANFPSSIFTPVADR